MSNKPKGKTPKKGRRAAKRAAGSRAKPASKTNVSVSEIRFWVSVQWDEGNIGHAQRHGIRLGAVESALCDGRALILALADDEESGEQRFMYFARVGSDLLRVIVTPRHGKIRPISSGVMTEREAAQFSAWESRTKSKKSRE